MQRLDRLERENRRSKRAAAALAIGIAAVVLMGQARPATKVVEAEQFVLLDPAGKPRGMLSVSPDGSAGLALVDKDGKPRAELGVEADGRPGLVLKDPDGNQRAVLDTLAGVPACASLIGTGSLARDLP